LIALCAVITNARLGLISELQLLSHALSWHALHLFQFKVVTGRNLSILIDELRDGDESYIPVSETLQLLSKATNNSSLADVKTYLLAKYICNFMPIYYRDDYFRFNLDQAEEAYVHSHDEYSSTYRALNNELKGDEYFSIELLNEFEPIQKYDIFAYKRGYHCIAQRAYDSFNKGDYVTGLNKHIEALLLKKSLISKVSIEKIEQEKLMPIELNDTQNNHYLALKTENNRLNDRLNKAVAIFKDLNEKVDQLTDQLEDLIAEKKKIEDTRDHSEIELEKVNTKLSDMIANKTEPQAFNWQAMTSFTYPPELHLAIIIWEKNYILNEINNPHMKDHSQRFSIITKNLGLDETILSAALIDRLSKITNPQINKQKNDIDNLKSIKGLNIKDLDDSNPKGNP